MVDDSTSFASDIEMPSTREWRGDEYTSCLTIMVYCPFWYDTEGTISTLVVPSEIYECLMDGLFGRLNPILRDWEDTEIVFPGSESLGVEF